MKEADGGCALATAPETLNLPCLPPPLTFFCILLLETSTSQYMPALRMVARTCCAYSYALSVMGTTMTCRWGKGQSQGGGRRKGDKHGGYTASNLLRVEPVGHFATNWSLPLSAGCSQRPSPLPPPSAHLPRVEPVGPLCCKVFRQNGEHPLDRAQHCSVHDDGAFQLALLEGGRGRR